MLEVQRLYVSPFYPDLLPVVLSGSLSESAKNITYHTLQTFPDRQYGYLDLPVPEADRLRQKLHGAILRGAKMKVEKARPEKAGRPSKGADQAEKEDAKTRRKDKKTKQKTTDGILPGVELSKDRKVKRGWTEPVGKEDKKSVKKRERRKDGTITNASIHTNGPECLFKTNIPPNASSNVAKDSTSAKSKKRKRGESERSTIVHEFQNNTKHAKFLRDAGKAGDSKSTSSYISGKGWVDGGGNVLEQPPRTRITRSKAIGSDDNRQSAPGTGDTNTNLTERPVNGRSKSEVEGDEDDETSSSGSSDNSKEEASTTQESDPNIHDTDTMKPSSQVQNESDDVDDQVNSEQVRGLSISRLSPTPPLPATKEVHPLEALFKRPQSAASQTPRKPSLEVRTGFSFFEPDAEQPENTSVAIPQTPFTQQDFQERRLRSAAPTPDTAAPSKTTFGRVWSFGSGRDRSASEEDEDEEAVDSVETPIAPTSAPTSAADDAGEGGAKESEFAKWFYEHRGENNRTWKRRRREAAKEKRQKENKSKRR
ncbi:MAG: hypothetical protein Q9174_004323 [Haloplaca sp. 1 TL-2023]